MRRVGFRALVLAALLPAACHRAPPPHPHFVLGAPYEAGGIWRYPQERYQGTRTGLAVVQPAGHGPLTTDGEAYDPQGMQAASPVLQLPAIARVTNLETGRQVVVRIDDRGPVAPGRLIAVTPGVASLLGMRRGEPARVRVTLLPAESHAAADDLPGAPHLAIAAAPLIAVTSHPIGASPQAAPASPARVAVHSTPALLHLPRTVTRAAPEPGALYVRLSPFTDRLYAVRQAEALSANPARVAADNNNTFAARLGPFATVAQADAALDRAIRAGVTDARIVVE